jgi:predicted hydrolase (HD superfamily)
MPNREESWNLLCEYTQSESLRKHALAVEACVRAYARKFNADEELWGVTALLHDFDYERWPNAAHHPTK